MLLCGNIHDAVFIIAFLYTYTTTTYAWLFVVTNNYEYSERAGNCVSQTIIHGVSIVLRSMRVIYILYCTEGQVNCG